MKERYIILAEPGCSGHFICSLLQTMHNESFYNDLNIENPGAMDSICGASKLSYKLYKLYESVVNDKNFSIYPERNEAMDILLLELNNERAAKHYKKEHLEIHVIHYRQPENIDKFLALPNTKIIFVDYSHDDYKRIAVNSVTKNLYTDIQFMESNFDWIGFWNRKNRYVNMLRITGFDNQANELELLDTPSKITPSLMNALIQAQKEFTTKRNNHKAPCSHPDITILNFNDLYFNKELIMKSLSDFTNHPINNNVRLLYDDYLSKQPNIDLY